MQSHILIIGASSGIGRQLALQYSADGHKVTCLARRSDLLKELKELYPMNIECEAIDVGSVKDLSAKLEDLTGRDGIETIINCASIVEDNPTLNDAIEWATIDVNVTGFVTVSNWAYRQLVQQGSGQYAAITSVFGARGRRLAPSYNASKAFQIRYLEGLRQKAKNGKKSIYITDLRPGYVSTRMGPEDNNGLPVIGAERAAMLIIKGLRRKRGVLYIPYYYRFIEWLFKLIPSRIYDRM